MSILAEQVKRIQRVRAEFSNIVIEELRKQSDFISDLNRQQLQSGTKADGSKTPKYVSDSKQPSAPGNMKFFEFGDFYSGIKPLFDDDQFDLVGEDKKTDILVGKYGKLIGLTSENISKLALRIKPKVEARIRKILI